MFVDPLPARRAGDPCGVCVPVLASLLLLVGLAAPGAHAARPMVTDDARIVDAKACQLESWVRHDQAGTEAWAMPACNFTGNLELALGGALRREGGRSRWNDVQAQAKTVLVPLEAGGWGIGLAGGTVRHPGAGARDWYAYLPASFSLWRDAVVVHANVGWLRAGESGRDRATWGLGAEARLAGRTWLIAETYGQGEGRPFHQIGLRHWLVPEQIQVDLTYGDRNGGGERWLSIGLRLLSAPFLP